MEEKIKLMEMQIQMLQHAVNGLEDTVKKMDGVLAVVAQWTMMNKQFMDSLQVNKPNVIDAEIIKPEEKK